MCGIAGIISKQHVLTGENHLEVNHLLKDMKHRGPDASDMRACSSQVILGSNRLAITDAHNSMANMPFSSPHNPKLTIVFNGEIYNFKALRQELSQYHKFNTRSDTEVLLAAFEQWGKACLDKLEGMFAFAIHDASKDSVFLATDPTGQKPIYYYEDDNDIIFSSEMEPLINNPNQSRKKTWNLHGMREFLTHRYIFGEETHINEIKKIDAGCSLEVLKGKKNLERYYVVPIGDQEANTISTIQQNIREAVIKGSEQTLGIEKGDQQYAIEQQGLEVPYGILFSGGIDSTSVLAVAKDCGLTPDTYSVGFEKGQSPHQGSEAVFNEFEYSQPLSKHYQTQHQQISLSSAEYCDLLDEFVDMTGEPLGSQEGPCLVKLFEAAQQNKKVILTGAGPDELFDGYSYSQMVDCEDLECLPEAYFDKLTWLGPVDIDKLMPRSDLKKRLTQKYKDTLALYTNKIDSPLQAVQLLLFHGRLPNHEFRQMDVIGMRNSVEARSPLVNRALIEAAFNFDPKLKQFNGVEKGIFKEAMRGLVPNAVVDRKKQGFPVPQEIWFSEAFEARVKNTVLSPAALISSIGLVDKDYMLDIWENKNPAYRNVFSRLYMLERMLSRQSQYVAQA